MGNVILSLSKEAHFYAKRTLGFSPNLIKILTKALLIYNFTHRTEAIFPIDIQLFKTNYLSEIRLN